MNRLARLIVCHGGIRTVRTHAVWETDRATGLRRRAWANTITCHDGYQRTLTTYEERALKELPEELLAEEHIDESLQ